VKRQGGPVVVGRDRVSCTREQRVRDTFPRPNRFVLVPDDVRGSKMRDKTVPGGTSTFLRISATSK
jgi:hypothetical protein